LIMSPLGMPSFSAMVVVSTTLMGYMVAVCRFAAFMLLESSIRSGATHCVDKAATVTMLNAVDRRCLLFMSNAMVKKLFILY